jgi:rubredoxin
MSPNWSCPKCRGRELIHVPGSKGFGGVPTTRFARGNLLPSRFICASCGFVEEYFETAEHLKTLRAKYGASAAKRKK